MIAATCSGAHFNSFKSPLLYIRRLMRRYTEVQAMMQRSRRDRQRCGASGGA